MRNIGKELWRYRISATTFTVICALLLIAYVVTKKVSTPSTHTVVITTAVPSVAPEAPLVPTIYLIKKGDTLTKIARSACTGVETLALRNNILNPDKIYAGKKLTYLKGQQCTPESVKSRTFPEKHLDRPSIRASQEKLLHSPPTSAKQPANSADSAKITQPAKSTESTKNPKSEKNSAELMTPAKTPASSPEAPRSAVKEDGCKSAGDKIADYDKRILARALCVKLLYGEFIKDAVLQDPRISHIDVVAIMLHESHGNPRAVSPSKVPCLGLMQLQPPTAVQYGVDESMIFDPKENIRGSVRILSAYTYRYFKGSRDYGLAAYNRGPNSKLLRQKDFDPNSLAYVQHVKKISQILISIRFAL